MGNVIRYSLFGIGGGFRKVGNLFHRLGRLQIWMNFFAIFSVKSVKSVDGESFLSTSEVQALRGINSVCCMKNL